MTLSSFSSILTSQNKIATPSKIRDVSGYDAGTYAVAGRVYVHFSEVHTVSEFQRVLDEVAKITHTKVKAKISGGELILTLSKRVFQKAFS
jgi:hypothetical protein